jgi:hypothetical protein
MPAFGHDGFGCKRRNDLNTIEKFAWRRGLTWGDRLLALRS